MVYASHRWELSLNAIDDRESGVNADTLSLAPRESMQFGRALQRVMRIIIRANPKYGPVYLAKVNISDIFYQVWLQLNEILKLLGVALPSMLGTPPLVAFPLALPMGWVESPPYFTALTETARKLASAHRAPPPWGPPAGGSGRHTSV